MQVINDNDLLNVRFHTMQALKGLAALFIAIGHYIYGRSGYSVAFILGCDFFFLCTGITDGLSIDKRKAQNSSDFATHLVTSKLKRLYLPYACICIMWLVLNRILVHVKVSLYSLFITFLGIQCMGFSHGEKILNASSIGISWYLSVDFWVGTVFFIILFAVRKNRLLSTILKIVTVFITWNILVNTSPNFMDVHYATFSVGNIVLTYAMVRALLGYSFGLLVYQIWKYFISYFQSVSHQHWFCPVVTLLEAGLIAVIAILFTPTNYNRERESIFPFIAAALLLLSCLEEKGLLSKLFATKPFTWLGGISFYLYLTHMFFVVILNSLLPNYSLWIYLPLILIVASAYKLFCDKLSAIIIFNIKKLRKTLVKLGNAKERLGT